MSDTTDRTLTGGARETAGLIDGQAYHAERRGAGTVDWTEPGLYVTRLRLISDPGFPMWDVSYCHGILNGQPVNVQLPFYQLPKRGLTRAIVEAAKRDRVYARGLGILDNISTLS
jgi:hypothetical protein